MSYPLDTLQHKPQSGKPVKIPNWSMPCTVIISYWNHLLKLQITCVSYGIYHWLALSLMHNQCNLSIICVKSIGANGCPSEMVIQHTLMNLHMTMVWLLWNFGESSFVGLLCINSKSTVKALANKIALGDKLSGKDGPWTVNLSSKYRDHTDPYFLKIYPSTAWQWWT